MTAFTGESVVAREKGQTKLKIIFAVEISGAREVTGKGQEG
jgi:hypothetical protein